MPKNVLRLVGRSGHKPDSYMGGRDLLLLFYGLFVAPFGPGTGGVITLKLTMQAQYFSRKAFGAIQEIIMAILILGTMPSPLPAGYCFKAATSGWPFHP
jgi:hypothetical protein